MTRIQQIRSNSEEVEIYLDSGVKVRIVVPRNKRQLVSIDFTDLDKANCDKIEVEHHGPNHLQCWMAPRKEADEPNQTYYTVVNHERRAIISSFTTEESAKKMCQRTNAGRVLETTRRYCRGETVK